MRNKKGMSPLIATVLLIAFAVALGAMIMNWSTDVQEPTEEGHSTSTTTTNPCADVQIELNEVFGKTLFCYDNEMIKFNIVNMGSREITGIQLRTVDANLKEIKKDIPNSALLVGGTLPGELAFDKSGKVHVELVPYIIENNKPQYCVAQRIVQDVLPDCANE